MSSTIAGDVGCPPDSVGALPFTSSNALSHLHRAPLSVISE